VSEGYGGLEFVERSVPEPGPHEVLVRIRYGALCGSDVRFYQFEEGYDFIDLPRILGHEFAGEVAEVGKHVTQFQRGDRVLEQPIRPCGHCYQCQTGYPNICQDFRITGAHHDGGFAPYIRSPESALHRVPPELTLRSASMVEPTSVAVRAVNRNSRVRSGDRVLVQGPGPIGLLAAQVASNRGASVWVAGVEDDVPIRLSTAADLGFKTVNIGKTELGNVVQTASNSIGFDVIFDATGHPSALPEASQHVRKGGQIVVIGQAGPVEINVTPMVRSELDLQFSYASTWEDFERAIRLLSSGAIQSEEFLDDRYSILKPDEAFEAALEKKTIKPVFDLDELVEEE